MGTNNFSWVGFAFLALYFLIRRFRKVKRVFVTDYMRGIRFVDGAFDSELGPGSYQVPSVKQQVELVDMRPQPIILDRTFYKDAWQNDAMVTIGAELQVRKARVASSKLKDQINDSMPVLRDGVRTSLSRMIAEDSSTFRTEAAAAIKEAVNTELKQTGMRITNVEILESWTRAVAAEAHGVAQ